MQYSKHNVIVFDAYRESPIYHLISFGGTWKTACGRSIGSYRPLTPKMHAGKFARMCKDCSTQEVKHEQFSGNDQAHR